MNSAGLVSFVEGALKLGGFLYVLGFVVIMVHTSSLGVPVVEVLQFQSILAGWPVGLAMWVAWSLWPWARRSLESALEDRLWLPLIAGCVLLSVAIVRVEIGWFSGKLSVYANLLIMSAAVFFVCLGFLYSAYQSGEKVKPWRTIFAATSVYSLIVLLALGYAVLVYPHMAQSIGGGRPVPVKLCLKSAELKELIGTAGGTDDKANVSGPVYLYYRTKDAIMISKDAESSQPLIQIPSDQVDAIVWLQSNSDPRIW